MFKKIASFLQQKEKPNVLVKNWRVGMWVISDGAPAILVKIDEQAEVHFVDKESGETSSIKLVPLGALTQAHYDEIPICRRKITKEQAQELGYGT